MNVLQEIRDRFQSSLAQLTNDPAPLVELIKPAQDARHGDYQANCAMPLKKQLDRQPREIAAEIVANLDVADLCDPPEIAGPGFINLRLKTDWINNQLKTHASDDRLGVPLIDQPRKFVIDYSSPNVAKPMHVGHIRSTVIGDSLTRSLRFLGHEVISDNHLGDWGTQFGMIIYGYKHFADQEAYATDPVPELSRLYRLVHQLIAYHSSVAKLPTAEAALSERIKHESELQNAAEPADKKEAKKQAKALKKAAADTSAKRANVKSLQDSIAEIDAQPEIKKLAEAHPEIASAVLQETAQLHAGDATNRQLWEEFLPHCRVAIARVYDRLDVKFDHEYGESFYHGMLADVVADFRKSEMIEESDGALCVFLDGFDAPMIVQKQDGAFLYATTDLATIKYRMETWQPDAILYVVDFRQGEHFQKLFAAARKWGYSDVELTHVEFGTVMNQKRRPYKTREGDAAGLEGLLDDAVAKAAQVVAENDDSKSTGAELSAEERAQIADVIGHGAVKYSDLSHNRTTDYVFDFDEMTALTGDTATYMVYSYARVQSIFRRGETTPEQVRQQPWQVTLNEPAERALAMKLLRFPEAVADVGVDYRPNFMTAYLYELAKTFSTFFQQCPVLKSEEPLKTGRLQLCDMTARTLRKGLELLGIGVVGKM